MIARGTGSVKQPNLKFIPKQIVFSAVVPELRGIVVGIHIGAEWHCMYEIAWETMTTSMHNACELQLEPLMDDDRADTNGFLPDWN